MILLDYRDSRPIYEQVVEKLQEMMLLGILEEDSQMPSVRSLATELSINPNTIQRAYGELERRGFIYMVKGRGSFVGSIRRLREAKREDLAKKMGVLAKEAKGVDLGREEFIRMAGQEYDRAGASRYPENTGPGISPGPEKTGAEAAQASGKAGSGAAQVPVKAGGAGPSDGKPTGQPGESGKEYDKGDLTV